MSSDKLYGHFEEVLRDQHNGDNRWYAIHAEHMTSEGLHAKSEIAAELAYRDAKIEELKGSVAGAEDCLWWSETGRTELKKRIKELEDLLRNQPSEYAPVEEWEVWRQRRKELGVGREVTDEQ